MFEQVITCWEEAVGLHYPLGHDRLQTHPCLHSLPLQSGSQKTHLSYGTYFNNLDCFLACQTIHRMHSQPHFHEVYTSHLGIFQVRLRRLQVFQQIVPLLLIRSTKITLRSGFIGIGSHNSIIDYIYYSYIANPVFVKILIFKKKDKQ